MAYALYFLELIGALFALLTIHGIALNGMQCAIALDQWLATCLFSGAYADETISAMAHRRQWKRTERFINWLFRDDLHCARAYIAELVGTQNDRSYKEQYK